MRYAIVVLGLLCCSPTFDITRPVSNAPDLVSFLAQPRACFTPCGMRTTSGDCEALQRYERRVVERLAREVPGWTEEGICSRLNGYEVTVEQHGDRASDALCSDAAWYSEACRGCVIGCTVAETKSISLAKDDWQHSALAHEIGHVADDLKSGHCPWKRVEFREALYELAGFIDPSSADPSCSP